MSSALRRIPRSDGQAFGLHQIEQERQEFGILDPVGVIDTEPFELAGDPAHAKKRSTR